MWRADEQTGSGRLLTRWAETSDIASSPEDTVPPVHRGVGVAVGGSPVGRETEYENTHRRWDDGA